MAKTLKTKKAVVHLWCTVSCGHRVDLAARYPMIALTASADLIARLRRNMICEDCQREEDAAALLDEPDPEAWVTSYPALDGYRVDRAVLDVYRLNH